MGNNGLQQIAVLIDADNTQLYKLDAVLQKISQYGRIAVKRAYGNWKKEVLKNWEGELNRLVIKAVQQFDYVAGKNTTDIALVIDAVDLLYQRLYDIFVIVSNDSDYTPLAVKLREAGTRVIGVGTVSAVVSFRNACDDFLYLENFASLHQAPIMPPKANEIDEIHGILKNTHQIYQDSNGFTNVAIAGNQILKVKPEFDCRDYGFKKLTEFLEAFPERYLVVRQKNGSCSVVTYRYLQNIGK